MEFYDGTSWSVDTSLTTARSMSGGAGTGRSAVIAGGASGLTCTEEWTKECVFYNFEQEFRTVGPYGSSSDSDGSGGGY